MSAIVVIYHLDQRPVEPRLLDKALDKLTHRGSDDRGVHIEGNIGMGHRMRWTTPESLNEKLPFRNKFDQPVITCDARIDNREELLSRLHFNGRPAAQVSDSEIILKSYEKWGEDCPSKLIGDYVFAIWDPINRRLFCARDPLGLKHFYYCHLPGKLFALASEIKALFAIPTIPNSLDEDHLADYLVPTCEDKEATFYQHIKRLPATHCLTVERGQFKTRSYWEPDCRPVRLKSDADYQEAFREKLTEAVSCRLRTAFPVGATLSGGLDSSAVVCIASDILKTNGQSPLQTFSAVFPTISKEDPRIDETRYMNSVIAKTGAQAHFVNVDDANPLQDMDKIVWHTDHPVGPINVYMDMQIFKAARDQGVRTLLTGHDGDATVTYGYQEFQQLARKGRFLRLMREARAMNRNMPGREHSLKRLLWHQGVKPAIPDILIKAWRTARLRKESDRAALPVYHPLHFGSVNPTFRTKREMEQRVVELNDSSYRSGSSPAEYHWQSLTNGIFSTMHEQVEKLSAAYEIDLRHPFFDRRLIEFCVGLPPGQRILKGWTRSIFRFAMEGILPADVQWRVDKANLGAHIKINLLRYGSTDIDKVVRDDLWKLDSYIDTKVFKSSYEKFASDPNRRDPEALFILTNMYLLKWLELSGFTANRQVRASRRFAGVGV